MIITCPDLQSVAALIAEDKLTETAYTSPAGPIAPIDILYGHRPQLMAGNLYMAHRCGFTKRVLMATLQQAGFPSIAAKCRPAPYFDIWAVALCQPTDEAIIRQLAESHFPG